METSRRKKGRPPKQGDKKSTVIKIRMTDTETEMLRMLAKQKGTTMSSIIIEAVQESFIKEMRDI